MARPDDLLLQAPQRDNRPDIRWRNLLDSRWYSFRLAWNVRDRRWYLDVSSDTGDQIVVGLAVEAQISLLEAVRRDELPPGQLFVEDVGGFDRRPGQFTWLSYSRLFYRPAAVVELARGTTDEVR